MSIIKQGMDGINRIKQCRRNIYSDSFCIPSILLILSIRFVRLVVFKSCADLAV
jgi:uncharacterized membrane protein YGL010W